MFVCQQLRCWISGLNFKGIFLIKLNFLKLFAQSDSGHLSRAKLGLFGGGIKVMSSISEKLDCLVIPF